MSKSRLNIRLIVSAVAMLVVMAVTQAFGDYFFDLNDDVLMKDILSGTYTGVPEGRNIQMLYPISWFISCLYRTGMAFDWYGIFLCGCQYFCFFLILHKLLTLALDVKRTVIYAASFITVLFGFFWPHFLFVQYTVTCGLLSSTAAFLILTADEKSKRDNIIALVLIIIAYLLRTEMLLLTLPMVGVAILIRWTFLRSRFCEDTRSLYGEKKELFKKYACLCIFIVLGLAICTVIHKVAYSGEEWKEFTRFFDNRTELYDFQYIPDYDENEEFYKSIGLTKSEQQLLINYNFELDDEINADIVGKVAEYADSIRNEEAPFSQRFKEALSLYIYRLHYIAAPKSYEYPMTDYPWNVCVVILYLGAFIAVIAAKDKGYEYKLVQLVLLAVLFACRSTLWLYIIMRGRDPIRITHPLYLIETVILIGVLFLQRKDEKSKSWVLGIILGIIGCVTIPMELNVIQMENARRSEMRARYDVLYDYFDEHDDSYYLIDVYTSVSCGEAVEGDVATFSEKMFDRVDNSFGNHDLLGGWFSKSPAYQKKLARAGFDSVETALLNPNVYIVQNKLYDTEWIIDYYRDKGTETKLVQKDVVADVFAIYQLERID